MLKNVIFLVSLFICSSAFTRTPTTKALYFYSGFPVPTTPVTSLASSQGSPLEGFGDRFDRWKFLQNVLEGEVQDDFANQVLYHVLDGALKYPRPKYGNSEETGSPEMTAELREKIEDVLATGADGRVSAMGKTKQNIIDMLEGILPDHREDEDASKSVWDIVMELHGREMVKINETNPTDEWKICCLVARLLINFDFINYGIVTAPLL